nr:p23 cell envelope protein [Borrelia sp. BU AG58]
MKNMKNLLTILAAVLFITCDLRKIQDCYLSIKEESRSSATNDYANESLEKKKQIVQAVSLSRQEGDEEKEEEEKYETMEGSKRVTALALFSSNVTWIKTRAIGIRAYDGKFILDLKGKIRYSYSVSPVKLNGQLSKYTMPLVLFETTNGNGNLEVESFTLEDAPDLDFNKRQHSETVLFIRTTLSIPTKEESSEEGYLNSNPFGIIGGNNKTIPALTKTQNVRAKIKVKDNTNNRVNEYGILIDSSYLVRLIKEITEKNPGIEKVATDFKLEQ